LTSATTSNFRLEKRMLTFDCPRTCPRYGDRWCRFRPLLDCLGPIQVDSHTARIRVEYRDPELLKGAVLSLGWKWLGFARHHLFESEQIGHGFQPTGWKFP